MIRTWPEEAVFLALGGNLGDPLARIREAVKALGERLAGLRAASVYRSPPEDGSSQPDYLNTVVRGGSTAGPEAMLALARALEASAERRRPFRNAPRTLDVDVLFHGRTVCSGPDLTLPHPRWATRSFVVIPLLELDPDWEDPASGRTVAEVAAGAGWSATSLPRILDAEALWPARAS